jgi:branched-subunit amino acid transport protein AzlD
MSAEVIRNLIIIAMMVAATMLTRFLPFLLFPAGKKTPKYITYLGTSLPYATIGLLVVYCLKSVNLFASPFGLPEIAAIAVIVILHLWRGNSLISIGAGTVVYMLMVQVVFK